ncbi:hypothetical protein OROMI_030663 [Orobanche minor]
MAFFFKGTSISQLGLQPHESNCYNISVESNRTLEKCHPTGKGSPISPFHGTLEWDSEGAIASK